MFSAVLTLERLCKYSPPFISVPPLPSSEKTVQKKLLLNPFRGLEELESEAVEIFI